MRCSVLALRPSMRIVPTGGISPDRVPDWLRAGALAVGVGSALLDEPDLAARVAALRTGGCVPLERTHRSARVEG